MFQLQENFVEGLLNAETENVELINEDGENRAATENAEHMYLEEKAWEKPITEW